jgi:hypothetical protein
VIIDDSRIRSLSREVGLALVDGSRLVSSHG